MLHLSCDIYIMLETCLPSQSATVYLALIWIQMCSLMFPNTGYKYKCILFQQYNSAFYLTERDQR